MNQNTYRIYTKEWLENQLKQTTIPTVITQEFLEQLGDSLLQAKIKNTQAFNLNKSRHFPKEPIPERIKFNEIASTMQYLFMFNKTITYGNSYIDSLLGIRIDGEKDIWQDKQGMTYTTDTDFLYYIISLLSPKSGKASMNNTLRLIHSFSPRFYIETPGRNNNQHNTDPNDDRGITEFWFNFKDEFQWDGIPILLLFTVYRDWFEKHKLRKQIGFSESSDQKFRNQIKRITKDDWFIKNHILRLKRSETQI